MLCVSCSAEYNAAPDAVIPLCPDCIKAATCTNPCTEDPEGYHHTGTSYMGFAEADPGHAAAVDGHLHWWECMHCEAWAPDIEDEGEGGHHPGRFVKAAVAQ